MTNEPTTDAKTAGALLVAASLSTLVALTHHPVVARRTAAAVVEGIGRVSTSDQLVHGTLFVLLFALFVALCVFARRQGLHRINVLAGTVAYAAGAAATFGAMLIDGFFVPSLAAHYAGAGSQALATLMELLRACAIAIQLLTKAGLISIALATLLWSTGLLRDPRVRAAGIAGLAAVAAQVATFVFWPGPITPHTLLVTIGAQSLWYLSIGILLIRGEL